jgi:coenzyme F420-dependent glucose-6-phosphate dehydrogenase
VPLFAYHASHEQFPPSALLRYAQLAEQAGFTAISSSDHLQPWSERQGQSGFAWAWLGAAMQVISLPFSVVCAPGQRYHPVIIAQAAATLAELFPGRFRLALGSGEALNERVIGEPWPPKAERNARLLECVQIMRALWAGETVTHYGRVRVEGAKLYTCPTTPPCLLGAAVTAESARWVGGWADGLLTVGGAPETIRQAIDAFHEGGGAEKGLTGQDDSPPEKPPHQAPQTYRTVYPPICSADLDDLWLLTVFNPDVKAICFNGMRPNGEIAIISEGH